MRNSIIMFLTVVISTCLRAQQVHLEWDDNSDNEEGFCIEYKVNSEGNWISVDSVGPNVTTYLTPTFNLSDTVYFRVYAYNTYGNSGYTNVIYKIFENTIPGSPTIIELSSFQNNQLRLTWSEIPNVTGYNIYRSVNPFFTPSVTNRIGENISDLDSTIPGVQWVDTDPAIGNPDQNYFYVVSGVNENVEGQYSQRVGEFDYDLVITSSTNFNEIALPLAIQGINNAEELMQAIPFCNSVARWNPNQQTYEQYIPGVPPTNFSIETGYPYYVNVTQETVFTLMGEIVNSTFTLITTSSTNFNEIVLPMDKIGITKASELMADIPSCNSVAYWNANIQTYQQYIPGVPPTDFTVKVGYPYYVNVTSNVVWPESGGASKTLAAVESETEVPCSWAPHAVWGKIIVEDDIKADEIHFTAYFISRPDDKLTDQSLGCMLQDNYWLVQCHSFQPSWLAGDSIKIVFENVSKKYRIEKEVALTYQPFDQAEDVILKNDQQIPNGYQLGQNYPNPFNPVTNIPYQLLEENHVKITIYNTMGQLVRKLLDERKAQGFHTVIWDGKDMHGHVVSSNIYEVQMEVNSYIETRKILFLK